VDVPYLWHSQVLFFINFSPEGQAGRLVLGEIMILCKTMFSQERKDEGEQKEKVQTPRPRPGQTLHQGMCTRTKATLVGLEMQLYKSLPMPQEHPLI